MIYFPTSRCLEKDCEWLRRFYNQERFEFDNTGIFVFAGVY